MNLINGIIRLYCAVVLIPVLIGRRKVRMSAVEQVERCFDRLTKVCISLMGAGAVRHLITGRCAEPVLLLIQLVEYVLFYQVLSAYFEMLYIRIRGAGDISKSLPRIRRAVHILSFCGTLYWSAGTVLASLQPGFFGNMIHGGQLSYWAGQVWGILIFCLDLYTICRYRKELEPRVAALALMHVLLPLAGAIGNYLTGGFNLQYVGITFSILIIYMMRNEAVGALFWEKMQRSRVEVMESQIRPHFIFNCLNSIYSLCAEDPSKARTAAMRLGQYMKGSFAMLDAGGLVPMDTELDYIRNYLELEKLRFGDKLQVRCELENTGFKVPFLSVQPVVENAVKHGLRRKGGGTVTITSRVRSSGAEILVSDDGTGYDLPAVGQENQEHVGLANSRQRLAAELNAELTISSLPEKGTTVRIFIPADQLKPVAVQGA